MEKPAGWSDANTRDAMQERLWRLPVRVLVGAERAIFSFVGALFFVAAFALGIRSLGTLWALISAPGGSMIGAGTEFLDSMLLVLMIVELAYTVILSLRGEVLAAEPFLLVGLIAVIRRMLVITVGDVEPYAAGTAHAAGHTSTPQTI